MFALVQSSSPFSVRTHHKFRKIQSFLLQNVRTSAITSEEPLVRTGQTPPSLTVDVFYGQPLTIKYQKVVTEESTFNLQFTNSLKMSLSSIKSSLIS